MGQGTFFLPPSPLFIGTADRLRSCGRGFPLSNNLHPFFLVFPVDPLRLPCVSQPCPRPWLGQCTVYSSFNSKTARSFPCSTPPLHSSGAHSDPLDVPSILQYRLPSGAPPVRKEDANLLPPSFPTPTVSPLRVRPDVFAAFSDIPDPIIRKWIPSIFFLLE